MYSDWLKRCKVIITMVVVITFFGQTRTECPATVHRDVKGFGPRCKYRCNCANNEQCDNITGECPNGCLRGWMGPGCQYRNYATEHSAFAEQYYVSKGKSKLAVRAIDGNVNTCSSTASKGLPGNSTQQWWRVEFKNALYIVGLIITIPVSETGRLVSFNMPTQLNEMLEQPTGLFWNSSYAVDGKQTSDDKNEKNAAAEKTCTVVGGKTNPAWWSVEFGALFSIQEFDFFGVFVGNIGQNNSFIVMSGYKNSQDYQTLFTEESKPTDNLNVYYSKTKSFAIPVFGDFVRVEVTRPYLILCEFNVFAECPFGKCGWDCSNTCMCSSQTTGHNKIQGRCPYGCGGRWTGLQEKCNTHCSDTEWGPFCNMTCGQCKGKLACSLTDGACPNSCEPGWKPPLCEDAESQIDKDDQSLTLGIIVGLTVAVAVGVSVIISLLVIWKRKKSRASESSLYADYNASVTDVHVYDTLGARRETQHVYEAAKACTE